MEAIMMGLKGNVEDYFISSECAHILVDGALIGNQNYAQMRIRENEQLIVSQGLSWARGNFVDTAIANEITDNPQAGMIYNQAVAGYTWQYLQFQTKPEDNSMIIVRPTRSSNIEHGFKMDTKHLINKNSLRLGTINAKYFDDKESRVVEQLDLGLTLEDIDTDVTRVLEDGTLKQKFSKFYIFSYSMNEQREIDKAVLYMMNPRLQSLELIQDLSGLIIASQFGRLTEDEKEAVNHDIVIPQSESYPVKITQTRSGENA
ncbi:spr1630 family ClpXP-sensitive toxin [Furfurilactobacillus rossiae]